MTSGPVVDDRTVTFGYGDPDRRLAGVRLWQEVGCPGDTLEFRHEDGGWRLELPRPKVWRLEYLFELRHHDGGTETITDPANPRAAPGAFGPKSVVEFPGYRPPGWLSAPADDGEWLELTVPSRGMEIGVAVWSPSAPADRLLIAHDGPEYDRLAALSQFARSTMAAGRVPAFHLALLSPSHRDRWYSANPEYASALVDDLLPALHRKLGTDGPVVGMGPSLGGLAMLHAHRQRPGSFGGLFLQSGSFFVPQYDRQESGFSGYRPITEFVRSVLLAGHADAPVPTVLTCGTVEENLANNRLMTAALRAQGHPVALHEVPDAHNFTGWRDAFDPHLTNLLARVWT